MSRARPQVPPDPMTSDQALKAIVIMLRQYADSIENAKDSHEAAKIIHELINNRAPGYARDNVIREMLRKGYPYQRIAYKIGVSKRTINLATIEK